MTGAAKHRTICDCGSPAVVRLGSAWVCARCYEIDSMRLRLARERRQRERMEKRRALMDTFFGESVDSSPLHHY